MNRIIDLLGHNWKDILAKVFEEKIRSIHNIEGKLRDITIKEVKARKKKITKPHAEILKGTYHYNTSTRHPFLLKISEAGEANYEQQILKLISSDKTSENLPKIYSLLEGKDGDKVLVIESCTKKDFSDFGTNNLESKLMSYYAADKKGHDEKIRELKATRPEMFRKIAETLANVVKTNYFILENAGFFSSQSEKGKVELEVNGDKVCVPVKGKKYFRERFLERAGLILDYLGVKAGDKEKYLKEGREVIVRRSSEKRKDIFDWAELKPLTIVHGNLKAPNILITYNNDVKLIDWRRASIASHIVDQIFMYNPDPAKAVPDFEAKKIQDHYLRYLREPVNLGDLRLVLGEVKDLELEYVDSFREAVKSRLFYEGIKRASDISEFAKKINDKELTKRDKEYIETFKEHLYRSGEILDEFIIEDYVESKYSSLRDLKNWLIKTPIGSYMWLKNK